MIKLILLLVLAWLVVKHVLPLIKASIPVPPGPGPAGGNQGTPHEPTTGDMVRCAHCQVFVLRSEAIYSQNRFYCCQEHLQAGPHA